MTEYSKNIAVCASCLRKAGVKDCGGRCECPAAPGRHVIDLARDEGCPAGKFSVRFSVFDSPEKILPVVENPPVDLPANWANRPNVQAAYRMVCAAYIETIPPYPAGAYAGRGVVVCGGGSYFPMAVVVVKLLRHLGCALPVELWGLPGELPAWQAAMVAPLGVTCRRLDDADLAGLPFVGKPNAGWELKTFAALHTRFAESLHLDADSFPQRDPAFLFDHPDYLRTGAIFWPDLENDPSKYGNDLSPVLWGMMGLPDRREPDFESGQFVVNRGKWWRPLNLSNWLCRRGGEFYFSHVAWRSTPPWIWYGDKACPHVAARVLGMDYAMPPHRPWGTHSAECAGVPMLLQRDFAGNILFAHGTQRKWWTDATEPTSYAPIVPLDDIAAGFFLESRVEFFERMPPPFICAVTIAVGYADYIQATIANRRYLDDWLIVTVPGDPVIALCEREGIAYVADGGWLRKNGAVFNLGAGRNLGFAEAKRRHAGEENLWLLALDGDCELDDIFRPTLEWVEPPPFRGIRRGLAPDRLYGASRHGDGSESGDHGVSGFFQLFHAGHFPARSYVETARDCGKTDIYFRDQWKKREVLPYSARHLGTTWMDWNGRVSAPVGVVETKEQNGRRLWGIIHARPAVCELAHELRFIEWWVGQLVCPECRQHVTELIGRHPPDLSSPVAYAAWGWRLHDTVNRNLSKPLMGWTAACAMYGWDKLPVASPEPPPMPAPVVPRKITAAAVEVNRKCGGCGK